MFGENVQGKKERGRLRIEEAPQQAHKI